MVQIHILVGTEQTSTQGKNTEVVCHSLLKTYGMQQKQFFEGSSEQYNPTSRNKKNIK